MTTMTPSYRVFSLPQAVNGPEERRFRRTLIVGIGIWLLLVLVVEQVPKPERSKELNVPESVKIMMQAPPPKPIEKKKPEEKPKVEDQPTPEPVKDKEVAKKQAQKEIDKIKDQLAALQDVLKLAEPLTDVPLDTKVDGPTKVDRTLIASNVKGGASGINTASIGTGVKGEGGAIGTYSASRVKDVKSIAEENKDSRAVRAGSSGKATRSREEIDLYLDRNKSALYALYNRAVRENPDLQGVVVVKLTIMPSGEVSDCRVNSSELKNEDFEKKLCQRIKLFRFESKDVETMELTKPFSFFPAAN